VRCLSRRRPPCRRWDQSHGHSHRLPLAESCPPVLGSGEATQRPCPSPPPAGLPITRHRHPRREAGATGLSGLPQIVYTGSV
jgi:hypothetical protein